MTDEDTREVPEHYRYVAQGQEMDCGLPLYVDPDDWPMVEDYGVYMTINAMRLAIDRKLADLEFADNTIVFKFWTPQPRGSLKRKKRRVGMKAVVHKTGGGMGWIHLQRI